MKSRLYDEYIKRLLEANDESKTDMEHALSIVNLQGWTQGVKDAAGYTFNGDYYYRQKFAAGKMPERPLCYGLFLDWKSNTSEEKPANDKH